MRNTRHEYGVLDARNIARVAWGAYEFDTWYGNSAYFAHHASSALGIDAGTRRALLPLRDGVWLDKLHVCEHCFKYCAEAGKMAEHRLVCELNHAYPPLGTLVYADMRTPYLIKRIRGFRHELFCQNLLLFGKLFLQDKLVFYNVELFDFYVVYGVDPNGTDPVPASPVLRRPFVPMGFFSKEANSWEADNNLACVCVFPPYQRLRLGLLLIEFLYALASVTPGQATLGPEFPLLPFGRVTYLRYWSKRVAAVLANDLASAAEFSLASLAAATGFRKDDVLLTLEHMRVLHTDAGGRVVLRKHSFRRWCERNHVDGSVVAGMLDPRCLLI